MKNTWRLAVLFAALAVVFAASAKADTIDYTITGPGVSDTFSITQNPAFTGSANSEVIVPVSGLSGFGIYDLGFYSSADGGGLGAILNFGFGPQQYQITGPQLFSDSHGVLTLLTGNFNLSGGFALTATDPPGTKTPEPASALLLVPGLLGLGFLRKRVAVN